MMYDLVIDRSMVGQTIGPANGFLVDLRQTKSPVDDGGSRCAPDGTWVSGKIQLRGSKDVRDLICSDSLDVGGWSGKTKTLVANHSLDYRGELKIRCVPKGAIFEITLSDVELTQKERDERAKAMARKALEVAVAKLQKKADDLAPPEPAPPLLIEAQEPVPVVAEAEKPKTHARQR
jgi:hypothetical protein